MKSSERKKYYLFIDESGDPSFYANGKRSIVGTNGFKPILLIGMVKLEDKKSIRNAIIMFMDGIKSDPLYNTLPCITNPKGWYLHASYDNIEVQVKFIDFLRNLEGFKFYCVIGRKRLDVFHKKHNGNEQEFYFDLIYHLLKDRLNDGASFYQIYLSSRKKSSQKKLQQAIENAIARDNKRRKEPISVKYNSEIVRSCETPELSITDYLLWILQRYILSGNERFYKVVEEKYNLIIDLYDFENFRLTGKSNYYHSKNRFQLSRAGLFRDDGYI